MHTTLDFGTMLQIELLRQQHDERIRLDDLRRRCMTNLGRCLRDAGALCAAFDLGWEPRFFEERGARVPWRPGCRSPAPEAK